MKSAIESFVALKVESETATEGIQVRRQVSNCDHFDNSENFRLFWPVRWDESDLGLRHLFSDYCEVCASKHARSREMIPFADLFAAAEEAVDAERRVIASHHPSHSGIAMGHVESVLLKNAAEFAADQQARAAGIFWVEADGGLIFVRTRSLTMKRS